MRQMNVDAVFISSLNTAGKMEVLLWLNDIASEQAIRIH